MTTYRCRFVKPTLSEWSTVEASDLAAAVQEFHDRDPRAPSYSHSAIYTPDETKPGSRILFALIETEGHGELVSRLYRSGIVRRGGVKPNGWRLPTIQDIAKAIGWERDPAELLEPGWEGEEETWA